jgi:micrococcal nuclease
VALAALIVAALSGTAHAQTVTKVTSGDTVVISGVGKIRLLGVRSGDDPAFTLGKGATASQPRPGAPVPATPAVSGALSLKRERPSRAFLRELVLGKHVKIQYDRMTGDKSGSYAYVFLEDGTMVNAEMLRAGKARVDLSRAFAHQAEFTRLEQEARGAGLGIWTTVIGRP